MDAHYRCEHGCKQHLQGHRNPADKKAYGHTARYRATVKVPHHWLGEGISDPEPNTLFLFPRSTQLRLQRVSKLGCIGQTAFKPVIRHVWSCLFFGSGSSPSLILVSGCPTITAQHFPEYSIALLVPASGVLVP